MLAGFDLFKANSCGDRACLKDAGKLLKKESIKGPKDIKFTLLIGCTVTKQKCFYIHGMSPNFWVGAAFS